MGTRHHAARGLPARRLLARLEEVGTGPFRPGPGGFPPHLAGREREQGLFRGLLARLDRGEAPPSEVILYGPRGNGKTVLLEWIGEFASGSTGVDVEELTPSEFKSPTRLAELLLPAGWWKTLKPDEIGVRGITWRPGKRSAAPDPAQVLALRAARKPLVGEAAGDDEVAAAAREFRHLGFVWQAGAMPEWEPGIPSLMDYMLRAVPAP